MTRQERMELIQSEIEQAEQMVEYTRKETRKWEALLDLRRHMLELDKTGKDKK